MELIHTATNIYSPSGKRGLWRDDQELRISIPLHGKTHEGRTNSYEYIFPFREKGACGEVLQGN